MLRASSRAFQPRVSSADPRSSKDRETKRESMSMSAIESLLEELTSSALDSSSSSRRRCLVEEVEGFLFNNDNKDGDNDGDNETSQQIQELTDGLALSIGKEGVSCV